ncbi:MAG: helix-turn-helix domain-containing protein [Flavisolibacter sp.]
MELPTSSESATPALDIVNEKLFDGQELMLTLHISIRTLQYWRSKGILPYYKIGNKIYYRQKDVEAMVQQYRLHKKG